MVLDKRGAAAPTFDDDKTTVDLAASDRARRDFVSVHDVPRVSGDDFDDLPTTIAPAPWAVSGDVPTGVRSTRRIRSAEQEHRALAPLPAPRTEWDDEPVTRIAPPPLLPVPFAGAVAAVGGAKKPQPKASPVVMASVVVLTLLAAMLTFGWLRQHERAQKPPPAFTTATAPAPPARPAPKPIATTAPSPAVNPPPPPPAVTTPAAAAASAATSAPPAPVPLTSGSPDEHAAVEAVQSGDLARAARLYTGLSTSHPTNDAYREAARILTEGTKEPHL